MCFGMQVRRRRRPAAVARGSRRQRAGSRRSLRVRASCDGAVPRNAAPDGELWKADASLKLSSCQNASSPDF